MGVKGVDGRRGCDGLGQDDAVGGFWLMIYFNTIIFIFYNVF